MATQIQTSLSSDIQRALQYAVGEANNAYTLSQKKESSTAEKRARDNMDESVVDTDKANTEKKKKKRKHDTGAKAVGETSGTLSDNGHPVVDPVLLSPEESGGLRKNPVQTKDNGKQPTSQPDIGIVDFQSHPEELVPQVMDLQHSLSASDNHQASSAAFLSAVVAAASATSIPQHPQLDVTHPQYQEHHLMPDMHQAPYVPYPSMQYGYDHVPQYGHPQQAPPLFPLSMGIPLLPDLQFGSNDDILRALQDLDVSKLANVLRTLGEAAAAANLPPGPNPGPGFMAPLVGQDVDPVPSQLSHGQVPAPSGAILSALPKPSKPSHNRVLDMSLPGPEQHMNPDHAHLLANKWMNASKLAELVKTEGLIYKKGKFSAIEDQQLKTAIENFRIEKSLTHEQVGEIIFQKNEKGKDNAFWSEITAAVPQRPIIAVYHHVRRLFHPMKQQGKWMPTEDALLKQAVADLGQQWERVSERVGRMSSDCRDRYRNHIANRDVRVTGAWTKEEEEELTRIVSEMTIQQGKDIDNDVFWGKVSERMLNTRGRQQCRIKWTDSLSKTVKNEGQKPRWSPQDAFILVHKVDSLNVRDDTEIDWKTLPDSDWNLWSAHSLQRRWLTMKRSIKGFEDMTHQEIMDILRVKKAQLPAPSSTRKRKVTSAANVHDPEANGSLDSDVAGYPEPGEAGPSARPEGTHEQQAFSPGQDRSGSHNIPADPH